MIPDTAAAIEWSMKHGLINNSALCKICNSSMELKEDFGYSSDGIVWKCPNKTHSKVSIRKNSWFDNSNLTITEILEFSYWWSIGKSLFFKKKNK